MKALGVIPARFQSSRLEGKPLADIAGKPMIQRVYEIAKQAPSLQDVIVATDDARIADVVRTFGGNVTMTSPHHASGTDRVAEIAASSDAEIFVNIQGDEPLLDPRMIDECVEALVAHYGVGMATVMKRVGEEAYADPGVVKVVTDTRGRALYFSRSPIPYPRTVTADYAVHEHLGLYAYTKDCLLRLATLEPTRLEKIEGLEQLRALENGIAIQVVETACTGELVSVDTLEDLEKVRRIFARRVCS
jgi:3-deoxy-manno-octulosonate cytidylyltransferase (CMP-KDO synthetase)